MRRLVLTHEERILNTINLLGGIKHLQTALEQVKLAKGVFRTEMLAAELVKDNQLANLCEDHSNALIETVQELEIKVAYMTEAVKRLNARRQFHE